MGLERHTHTHTEQSKRQQRSRKAKKCLKSELKDTSDVRSKRKQSSFAHIQSNKYKTLVELPKRSL